MSWLIESFLNETKEANKTRWHDHPNKYDKLQNADDFKKKKDREFDQSLSSDAKTQRHYIRMLHADKRDYHKYGDDKGKVDDKKAYDTVKRYTDKSDKDEDMVDRFGARAAVRRHNRKMEKQGKPQLESVDMLVEIFQ
jgi:hypothetical protein